MKRVKLMCAMLVFTLVVGRTAKAQQSFTLKEAQDYAVENSYKTKSAHFDVEKAKKVIKETLAIGLPQISGEFNFQNFLEIPTQVLPDFISPTVVQTLVDNGLLDPADVAQGSPQTIAAQFGTKYNVSGGIKVEQLIFDGSYFVGLKASQTYLQLSKNSLEKSEKQIKEDIMRAYASVLIAEENLIIQQEAKLSLEKTFKETKAFFENGFVEEQDVDQIRLLFVNAETSAANAERQVDLAYDFLKFQMGLPISESVKLKDSIKNMMWDSNQDILLAKQFGVEDHIDFRILATQEEVNSLALKNQKVQYFPRITASYNLTRNYIANDGAFWESGTEWFPSEILGVRMSVPIFSSFQKRARVQQAKIDLQQVQLQKLQVKESLELQAKTAKSDYMFYMSQYNNDSEGMELAEKIYGRMQIKYNEGVTSSMDLTQSHNQYLEKQGAYINSLFQLFDAKASLYQALNKF